MNASSAVTSSRETPVAALKRLHREILDAEPAARRFGGETLSQRPGKFNDHRHHPKCRNPPAATATTTHTTSP